MSKDTKPISCAPSCKKTSIGGQALMEGIMMRGPEKSAMAVRNAKGEIILETNPNKAPSKISKVPFVRGLFNMASSLKLGYKYLMRSADIAIADIEEEDQKTKEETAKEATEATETVAQEAAEAIPEAVEETAEETAQTAPKSTEPTQAAEEKRETVIIRSESTENEKEKAKKEGGVATTVVMVVGVILGVILALGLFIALPATLYWLLDYFVPANLSAKTFGMTLFRSAFEAVFKIILLVLYMVLVAQMKEIRRVFMYHGAEHKTIFCYEAGLDLTIDNVRMQKRFHPRCGTSFLILVLLVSLFIGILIPASLPLWLRIIIKIALLPLTVGIGYELIKLAGKFDNTFTRIISAPGVWLQHITTVEPDDSMIECAIIAMNEVIPEDKNKDNW